MFIITQPGTSGIISPFAKMDGLYFDSKPEEYSFYYDMMPELKEKAKKNGMHFIGCEFNHVDDFYDALRSLDKYAQDNVSVYGTSREGIYDLIIQDETDIDETDVDKEKNKEDKKNKK